MEKIKLEGYKNLSSMRYYEIECTLEIEMLNGKNYQYFDVPLSVYEAFRDSNHHNRFYSEKIRGVYRFSEVYKNQKREGYKCGAAEKRKTTDKRKALRRKSDKDLLHYQDTTVNLWATDRPDLLTEEEKKKCHLFKLERY